MNIAVTAVGGGVGQAVIRSLRSSQISARIIGLDVRTSSVGFGWADARHLVPPAGEEDEYVDRLLQICSFERLDALIPGSEPELLVLARYADAFRERSCEVIIAPTEVVELCADKLALAEFCRERDLPFARTWSQEEAALRLAELPFPVIAKPRRGAGSVGARLVRTPAELLVLPLDADLVIQNYLPPKAERGVAPLGHSERLNQSDELSVQFLVGRSGRVLGQFTTINRLKEGVPWEVVPSDHPAPTAGGMRIIEALVDAGLCGPINLQGRFVGEVVTFFEANARFTGLTGVRADLGFNEVEAAMKALVLDREDQAARSLSAARADALVTMYVEHVIQPQDLAVSTVSAESSASPSEGTLRVLVTGASGYIGANLVKWLLSARGVLGVIAGVRKSSRSRPLEDLADASERVTLITGELPYSPWDMDGVDVVVHAAAARPSPKEGSSDSEMLLVNAEGTRRLADAAYRAGVSRIVYLSSQAVYDPRSTPPWHESDRPKPDTTYGFSKLSAERQLLGSTGAEVVVLRLARVFGLGVSIDWHAMPHLLAFQSATGEPLLVHGTGERRLDLVHISDVCDAVSSAIAAEVPGSLVVNIGSGRPVAVGDLAAIVADETEALGLPRPAIEIVPRSGAGTSMGMDIRRARTVLDWTPRVGLRAGIRQLVTAAAKSSTS